MTLLGTSSAYDVVFESFVTKKLKAVEGGRENIFLY